MSQAIVTPGASRTPDEERNLWRTPPDLFAWIARKFGPFSVDGAANEQNHLCDVWFGPGSPFEADALAATWGPSDDRPVHVFINPPYGRGYLDRFMRKAHLEAKECRAATTLLIPATTEVPWFHDLVWSERVGAARLGVDLHFIRKRVRFCRPDGSVAGTPGMGSMIVRFRAGTV